MLVTSSAQLILYLMFVTCPMLVTSEGLVYSDVGVLAPGLSSGRGPHRDKREVTNKNMKGFSEQQKMSLLQKHNTLRALIEASDMLKMIWDPKLATLAQNYADQCKFEHSSNRNNVAGFGAVGENLYAGTGDFEPATVVQAWYDEVKDYNYGTNKCKNGAVCGHFTQVVWANSGAVGCGMKYCTRFLQKKRINFNSGYVVVCNYGPAGNYIGQKPYATGKPCSKCPKDKQFCTQGLCVVRPSIGDISLSQIPASGHSLTSRQLFMLPIILSLFVHSSQIN